MACIPDSSGLCIPPPAVSCVPPLLFRVNRCECGDGSMPIGFSGDGAICAAPPTPAVIVAAQCTVTISYTDPNVPQVVRPADPACDAGMQLALAVVLAAMLGMK